MLESVKTGVKTEARGGVVQAHVDTDMTLELQHLLTQHLHAPHQATCDEGGERGMIQSGTRHSHSSCQDGAGGSTDGKGLIMDRDREGKTMDRLKFNGGGSGGSPNFSRTLNGSPAPTVTLQPYHSDDNTAPSEALERYDLDVDETGFTSFPPPLHHATKPPSNQTQVYSPGSPPPPYRYTRHTEKTSSSSCSRHRAPTVPSCAGDWLRECGNGDSDALRSTALAPPAPAPRLAALLPGHPSFLAFSLNLPSPPLALSPPLAGVSPQKTPAGCLAPPLVSPGMIHVVEVQEECSSGLKLAVACSSG